MKQGQIVDIRSINKKDEIVTIALLIKDIHSKIEVGRVVHVTSENYFFEKGQFIDYE